MQQLLQLTEEISRIAAALEHFSTEASSRPGPRPKSSADVPDVSADLVISVIRARRRRGHYFADELFADPAWDMMLDLLVAEIRQLRVTVSSLCIASAVPPTTALRWIGTLVEKGIVIRRPDPIDARRVYVELSLDASASLRRYFADLNG